LRTSFELIRLFVILSVLAKFKHLKRRLHYAKFACTVQASIDIFLLTVYMTDVLCNNVMTLNEEIRLPCYAQSQPDTLNFDFVG
jgi:hypothetical protein